MKRANYKCEFCNTEAFTAHHVIYFKDEEKGGWSTSDRQLQFLVAVCKKCHNLCHGIRQGGTYSEEIRGQSEILELQEELGISLEPRLWKHLMVDGKKFRFLAKDEKRMIFNKIINDVGTTMRLDDVKPILAAELRHLDQTNKRKREGS